MSCNHLRYLYKKPNGQYYVMKDRKLTKKDIRRGIERNMVCFDSDAKPGELTNRLLLIMKDVAFDNQELLDHDTGETKEAYSGYHFWVGDIGNVDTTEHKEYMGENYDVTEDERLAKGGEFVEYLKNKLSATLAKGDNSLVVMFLNNNDILLGSY